MKTLQYILFWMLSIAFGTACMMLAVMLTADVYGALMGAIFAASVIALLWKV